MLTFQTSVDLFLTFFRTSCRFIFKFSRSKLSNEIWLLTETLLHTTRVLRCKPRNVFFYETAAENLFYLI